ncbi:MAG: ion transporter [Myxococcota bacterium]
MHLRERLHEIVFESDTPAGRAFDVVLLVAILVSVSAVVLETVPVIRASAGRGLDTAEWVFTALFTAEYVLRLLIVRNPVRYVFSYFGLVDLVSILPTWLGLVYPGAESFLVIRTLRLLRIFRVLKMVRFLEEARVLLTAVRASARKIAVFLGTVLSIVVIVGALMYVIEGPRHGYTSIPTSMYWAVVTLSTVGYGDIAPGTPLGKFLASLLMVLGYGMIAVPTGIVTVELTHAARAGATTTACKACGRQGHDVDATFCKWCGGEL